jgi:hypothetical protein
MILSITPHLKERHGAGRPREGQKHEATQDSLFLNRVQKDQLDAQSILSIFRQPYMFRAYLGPSSGGTTYVYNWCLFFFLDDLLD